MSGELHLVFVYGTLRSGHANHRLLAGARYLGRAVTKARYALGEECGPEPVPYVVKEPPLARIAGEVYEVGAAMLADLDVFEEHPGVYRREEVTVLLEGSTERRAWLYFARSRHGHLVPGGDWLLWRRHEA